MKQKQYSPLSVASMAVGLYAASEGYLKDVPVSGVGDYEAELLAFMQQEYAPLMENIDQTGAYDDDVKAQLREALDKFQAQRG